MIGTKLAHYEITLHLGSGGMGEVYQATDSKLGRSVAIKLLPAAFAGDTERVGRFEREARLLATLNHPNIASIYGLDQAAGRNLLVMELVSGETLAEKIARGPIPLDEALTLATQIARGLEAAHDAGIVHRDLKPANIKVTTDGQAKILDFGLAKAFEERDEVRLANSPTLMSASVPGVILGTAAYMSPEQAKGRNVDRRADIWAFGCVLFEMLSGQKVFEGETISEILAGILKSDPDWSRLPVETPAGIRRVLERCLRKDPNERKQSIGDVRIDLAESPKENVVAVTAPISHSRTGKLAWSAAATLFIALAVVGWAAWKAQRNEPAAALVRFELDAPEGRGFAGNPTRMVVSPNGRYVVFPVNAVNGQPNQLWLRRLDSVDARPIAGTEAIPGEYDPQSAFWSPDSKSIGFFTTSATTGPGNPASGGTSKVKRVDVDGGPVQTLCELPSNQGSATWNSDGIILLSTVGSNGVMRIPATGGVPVPVTTVDSAQETAHLWPRFLPDGRHFLYQVQKPLPGKRAVYAGSIDSKERTLVVESDFMAQFVPPHSLLYLNGESLYSQTMDLNTFGLTGEPDLVAKGVLSNINGRPGFSASDNGVLAYTGGAIAGATRQLTWMDRSGRKTSIEPLLNAFALTLSPDDTRAVFFVNPGTGQEAPDVFVFDLERGVLTRLTTKPTWDMGPVWSPDGTRIVYNSSDSATSPTALYLVQANGAVAPQILLPEEPGIIVTPQDWSADGKFILFRKAKMGSPVGDLWTLSLEDHKVSLYLTTSFDKTRARFSPDGHWVAYESAEGGAITQILVQPFPNAQGGKSQISTRGGSQSRWRGDNREIYYVDTSARMIAVPLSVDRNLVVGKPSVLFDTGMSAPGIGVVGVVGPTANTTYDVTRNGQRFLFSLSITAGQNFPITITLNWNSGLK